MLLSICSLIDLEMRGLIVSFGHVWYCSTGRDLYCIQMTKSNCKLFSLWVLRSCCCTSSSRSWIKLVLGTSPAKKGIIYTSLVLWMSCAYSIPSFLHSILKQKHKIVAYPWLSPNSAFFWTLQSPSVALYTVIPKPIGMFSINKGR